MAGRSCSDASTMSNRSRMRVAEVEPAVGEDVDLAAVQDRHLRIPLPERGDLVRLLRDAVAGRLRVAAGVRRVVGDGDVFVSERDAAWTIVCDRIAAVAPVGVHVQVAADVVRAIRARAGVRPRGADLVVPSRTSGGINGSPRAA